MKKGDNHVRPSRTKMSGLEPSFMVTIFFSQNYSTQASGSRPSSLGLSQAPPPGERVSVQWIWRVLF